MARKIKNVDALNDIFNGYMAHNPDDDGAWGKSAERALKVWFGMQDKVSAPGRVDFRRMYKNMEVKTGAGELNNVLRSKQKYVVSIPVVRPERGLLGQEGFIVDRLRYLEILEEIGLIRTKTTTAGYKCGDFSKAYQRVSIQTFWNHKLNKPHGKKYYDLLDALYADCIMTLEDYIKQNGNLEIEVEG